MTSSVILNESKQAINGTNTHTIEMTYQWQYYLPILYYTFTIHLYFTIVVTMIWLMERNNYCASYL
jgi:hypothetical protein